MASPKAVVVWIGRNSKRVGVSIVGGILVLVGIAGLALPIVPGWLLIIAGFAVLATEYVWAERVLDAAKKRARQAAAKARGMRKKTPERDQAQAVRLEKQEAADARIAEKRLGKQRAREDQSP